MGKQETKSAATKEEGNDVAEKHPPHPEEEVEKGVKLGDHTSTPESLES